MNIRIFMKAVLVVFKKAFLLQNSGGLSFCDTSGRLEGLPDPITWLAAAVWYRAVPQVAFLVDTSAADAAAAQVDDPHSNEWKNRVFTSTLDPEAHWASK